MVLELKTLGNTPPVQFHYALLADKKTKRWFVAEPNKSFVLSNGVIKLTSIKDSAGKAILVPVVTSQNWNCTDWVNFHKTLVKWGQVPQYFSKKLSLQDSVSQANTIVATHWSKNAGVLNTQTCALNSEFLTYFKSVGMEKAVSNFVNRAVSKTIDTTEKVFNTTQDTLVNVVDSASGVVKNVGDGIENVTGVAKYIVPAIGVGIVALVGTYLYKNYLKGNARVSVPTPSGLVQV